MIDNYFFHALCIELPPAFAYTWKSDDTLPPTLFETGFRVHCDTHQVVEPTSFYGFFVGVVGLQTRLLLPALHGFLGTQVLTQDTLFTEPPGSPVT